MTGRKNTIIAVSAIVLFASIVGFFITLDVSPQIAYARLFIDVGLVIGLIAVILAFYKERPEANASLVKALKDLGQGKYKTRVSAEENGPLADVISGFNELAMTLEKAHIKQEEIKQGLRDELLPKIKEKEIDKEKETKKFEHSFHPELGPVVALPLKSSLFDDETSKPQPSNNLLRNTLAESRPPEAEKILEKIEKLVPHLDKQDQDLGELYQRFIGAQKEIAINQIEYPHFLKSVEKTRLEIMKEHKCLGVCFDVVKEPDQVALQPRLIR